MGNAVIPAEHGQYDLDMDHHSEVAANIRVGLQAISTGNDEITLDFATDEKLRPFMSMFQFERIKRPFHFGHLLLLLYTPIGLFLILFRGAAGFFLALVFPRIFSARQLDAIGFHKILCWGTGTRVVLKDEHLFDRRNPPQVIAANHISEFDAVAVRSLLPTYVLGYDFYKKMLFFRLLGDKFGLLYVPYVSRNQGGAQGRDQIRDIIIQKLNENDKPLVFFPEGGLTNGRKGLLQYHKFVFSLGKTVQPLAIQATDGPFPININDETSTFMANVLWYLFVPWHTYTIQFLPVTRAEPNEDALQFAQRVMKQTARALHQDATPFLYRDKISFTRYKTRQLKKEKK